VNHGLQSWWESHSCRAEPHSFGDGKHFDFKDTYQFPSISMAILIWMPPQLGFYG
jgi:hypothetical protein